MEQYSSGARKTLALGLLALLTIIMLGLAVGPYFLSLSKDKEVRLTEQRIMLLERQLVERENLLADKRMLERGHEHQALSIDAETPGLGGANLQSIVTGIVEVNGGTLASTQIIEPELSEGFIELRIRVAFESDIRNLRTILHSIETFVPTLIIRGLNISSPNSGAVADPQERLEVSLAIGGFMRAPAEDVTDEG